MGVLTRAALGPRADILFTKRRVLPSFDHVLTIVRYYVRTSKMIEVVVVPLLSPFSVWA